MLPLAYVILQSAIVAVYNQPSLAQNCKKIFMLSSLTSWITPFTVLANNHLDRKTFLSTSYLIVSSLSMHTITFLSVAVILISNPHIKISECSKLPSDYPASSNQNGLAYSVPGCNSNESTWLIAFKPSIQNYADDILCSEKVVDYDDKLYFLTLLFATFIITGTLLQFFGNYYNFAIPFTGSFFVHHTVLKDMVMESREQEKYVINVIKKCRKCLLTSQDLITGETLLHVALKHGSFDLVKQTIESGSNLNAQDVEGWTALHWAAGKGRKECLELLIKNGAKIEAQDKNGLTALHYAAHNRFDDCVQLLTKMGGSMKAQDENDLKPLQRRGKK